jgi:hypothetical protein
VVVSDVVTSNSNEETTTIDITAQQETTIDENGTNSRFKVTKNMQGSTVKNVSTLLSHPSSPIDRTLLGSQG